MAVSIDYGNTYIITIPKADLTLISGTLYELDTDAFRLELKSIEASVEGMPFPKTHDHNTEYTVAGVTYARALIILSPYSVEFEDGAYSVRLEGSNNNIFDVEDGILVQNSVQVIGQNSAGLVVIDGAEGSGGSWTDSEKKQIRDALGVDGDKRVAKVGQLQKKSEYPYNSTIDSKDILKVSEGGVCPPVIIQVDEDLHYVHNQPLPSASWVIPHNLGKFPSVTVVDTSSNEVTGEVTHTNLNSLTITFSSAFAGKAYLN